MRTLLRVIHLLALGLWAGLLVAAAAGAIDLFQAAKPICPACAKPLVSEPLPGRIAEPPATCASCGAYYHARCLSTQLEPFAPGKSECVLDGGYQGTPATAPVGSAAIFTRVVAEVVRPKVTVLRVVWRADAVTPALAHRGIKRGECFALPFAAAGDSAARLFEVARLLGLVLAMVAFPTAFLTRPGGALRLFRVLAIVGAAAASIGSAALGFRIGELRNQLDAATGDAVARLASELGPVHGAASTLGVIELVLVLVAFALASTSKPEEKKPDGSP